MVLFITKGSLFFSLKPLRDPSSVRVFRFLSVSLGGLESDLGMFAPKPGPVLTILSDKGLKKVAVYYRSIVLTERYSIIYK